MKKEVMKILPAIKAKPKREVVKEVVVCDQCGTDSSPRWSKCQLCKRDICYDCRRYDPHETGDYPDHYCETCYGLRFSAYRDEFDRLWRDYNKKREQLKDKIRRESLNTPQPKDKHNG